MYCVFECFKYKFSEMQPIFKNTKVGRGNLSDNKARAETVIIQQVWRVVLQTILFYVHHSAFIDSQVEERDWSPPQLSAICWM